MNFDWLFSTDNASIVGGIGLLISAVGFPLTVWGLWMTYWQASAAERQARAAETSAAASAKAVQEFRDRVDRSNAAQDVHQALIAVDTTRRHLVNDAWNDALTSYDDARRAIIRCQLSSVPLPAEMGQALNTMKDHIKAFCDEVEVAQFGKGAFPDRAGVLSVIRGNYEALVTVKHHLDREVS